MTSHALPPAVSDRIRALEVQLQNITRAQNPVKGSLYELSDISAQAPADRALLVYDRSIGQWAPGSVPGVVATYIFGATSTAPAGTLLCNGASGLRTDYPALFAAIGTTYGSVDATHFTLPNFTDRFPVGVSGTKTIGSSGGSANAIAVSHDHTGPSHTHGTNVKATSTELAGEGTAASGNFVNRLRVDGSGDTSAAGGTGVTGTTGSSGTNANLPPWLACYVYIYY